jgi:hypothetical protein
MVKLNKEFFTKTLIPRVFKATLLGSITFLISYYLPTIILSKDILPFEYETAILDFGLIFVFFVVVGQLFSGTVIGCGIGIARALIIMIYFFSVSDGGIFNIELPIDEGIINLTVNISIILLMIISVNLLDIVKNILSAINIIGEKSTKINVNEIG